MWTSWTRANVESNHYVGSSSCQDCHQTQHEGWHDSAHRKMMRKATEPGVMNASWHAEGAPAFTEDEVVWVIGSKWEQQFMGADGHTETLLPAAWSILRSGWKLTGWDGWQAPVPLRRCHGCHTVGLDVTDGSFVEPGIGCESCHGRGAWHEEVHGSGGMTAGLDAETCGQCHARGNSPSGEYFFPVGFEPGGSLEDKFVFSQPDYLQNSSQWWGTGRERDRHQQFQAWQRGGHADALKSLGSSYDGRFGPVERECYQCHSAEYAVFPEKAKDAELVPELGVTCSVCHNVHGELDSQRMTCVDCHDNGAKHHAQDALVDHVPCPESAKVECIDCHMPITITIGGELRLRSHAPGITEPQQAASFDSPSSCANGGCHSNASSEDMQTAFDNFYRAGDARASTVGERSGK
nr:multiheme c-type cytochrome [Pseudomarimonas arenosa]